MYGLNPIISNPDINVTYDAILAMTDVEFLIYIEKMRSTLCHIWDTQGLAPVRGWTEQEVKEDFNQMSTFDVSHMWHTDELTGRRVIYNTFTAGNSVNCWNMDKMLRVRFNYTEKDNGRSIYQFFADDKLFKRYLPYARRHFLRDSFYFFAQTVKMGDALPHFADIRPCAAVLYVKQFAEKVRLYDTHEILIEAKKKDKGYTGYAEHLKDAEFFALTYAELQVAIHRGELPPVTRRVLREKELNDDHLFHVRVYEKGQHIFPALFKSFRISMCSYAHQYPPLTAKLIYDTFLHGISGPALIWDPSAGWGGRLLGALACKHELRYIGTDPNEDFYQSGNVYHNIRDYYNAIRSGQSLFGEHNDALVVKSGSEVFHHHPVFRKCSGKADLVYTSPPYFNREKYAEDGSQSCVKFSQYDSWREGFLRPTLQNAWVILKMGGRLVWNIADIKVGHKYLPLEQDTIDICESLGFKHTETIHMAMASMPGANRVKEDGTLTAKNMSKVDGKYTKHEPHFVFVKS